MSDPQGRPGDIKPGTFEDIVVPAYGSSPSYTITSAMMTEHNLQGLVQLVYVREGNQLMTSALSQLGDALQNTKEALDALSQLQALHNSVTIPKKGPFPFNFSSGGPEGGITQTLPYTFDQSLTSIINNHDEFADFYQHVPVGAVISKIYTTDSNTLTHTSTFIFNGGIPGGTTHSDDTYSANKYLYIVSDKESYIAGYTKLASAFYGAPIVPVFTVSVPAGAIGAGVPPASLNNIVLTSGSVLSGDGALAFEYFKEQLAQTKAAISGIISSLRPITDSSDPTTLLRQLSTVYAGLPGASFSSISKWIVDGYATGTVSGIINQGAVQQTITSAITAAQSLNDSQKQAVSNYMFIFEEYYKSAAMILSKITQIIEKMAATIRQ